MGKLTNREISAVWWAFIWRAALLGLFGGSLLGAVSGFVLTLFHYREWVTPISGLVGVVWQLIVARYVIGVVLRRRYNGFSIEARRSDISGGK